MTQGEAAPLGGTETTVETIETMEELGVARKWTAGSGVAHQETATDERGAQTVVGGVAGHVVEVGLENSETNDPTSKAVARVHLSVQE